MVYQFSLSLEARDGKRYKLVRDKLMKKESRTDRFFKRHPLLIALLMLALGLANLYEAVYTHAGDKFLAGIDWLFVVIGFAAFIGLLYKGMSEMK